MVYQNKLVAAIKVGGQVLRESDNTVILPFGAEYSIYLKNLDSRRIQVKVHVDGVDATDKTWLVIDANSSIDLKRFIRDGNWEKGNAFKFIERTQQIEKHKGIGTEDGLIRVEYKREKIVRTEEVIERRRIIRDKKPWPYNDEPWDDPTWPISPKTWPYPKRPIFTKSAAVSHQDVNCSSSRMVKESAIPVNDVGITVPGSESYQKFVASAYFPVETQSEVIVLKLVGEVRGKTAKKPVTVSSKSLCPTCGQKNKSSMKFCSNCGTSVTLI